jgi:hypothetical protein
MGGGVKVRLEHRWQLVQVFAFFPLGPFKASMHGMSVLPEVRPSYTPRPVCCVEQQVLAGVLLWRTSRRCPRWESQVGTMHHAYMPG